MSPASNLYTHTLARRTARGSARIVTESSRAASLLAIGVVLTALGGGCSGAGADPNGTTGTEVPVVINAQVDDKSRLYNMIGRWYPSSEVVRLRDDTITPEDWCRAPPVRLVVLADSVEMHCSPTDVHMAPLARVRTTTNAGELILTLRVGKDAPLRQLRFEDIKGPRARISGSPCPKLESAQYERFPDYEVLTRQILNGKRCSQVDGSEGAPTP